MFKKFKCRCHVCGAEFEYKSEFFSVSQSYADGRLRITCNISRELPSHSKEEIQESYANGGNV